MKKRLITGVLASLLSSTSIAATDITWWHAMSGQLGETVNTIARDFNASQDEYKIKPVFKGSYVETLTAGIAAYRADQAPNILQVADVGAATIINAPGVAKPVEDILVESGYGFNNQDYIAGVRNFYADSDGKMIGMPFNSSTPVLYYNKNILAKVGVDAPKTYEEMEQVAKKLKAQGYATFSQSLTPWIMFENFKSRHNLPVANKNNGFDAPASKIMINTPDIAMHFSKLKDWSDKGYYKYYGSDWDANQQPFEKEQVAMWLGSSGSFGGLRNRVDFDLGTTYLPYWKSVNKDAGRTFIGGAALFAIDGKPKKEQQAVAAFFSFLTSPETQMFWHKSTGYVTVTKAAYELTKKSGYYQEQPDAEVGVKQLSLPGGEWTRGYRLGFYSQIQEVMHREFDNVFANRTSVEKALSNIDKESQVMLSRFARTVR